MALVDKRTINASYTQALLEKYGQEEISAQKVLHDFLSDRGFTDDEINKIVEVIAIENARKAMELGDFVATTADVLKTCAKIEPKTLGEINTHYKSVMADRYGVSDIRVDVYDSIPAALKVLEKIGRVEVDRENERAFKYKYIAE